MVRTPCGEAGGVTGAGTPCKKISKSGSGLCFFHDPKMPKTSGQPAHAPDAKGRRFVEICAMSGMVQEDIIKALEISKPTLLKHYRKELDSAYVKANAKVAQTMFEMATSGSDTSATIFWMKCRLGWSTKEKLEISGPDGGPIELEANPQARRARIAELTKLAAGDD